MESHQELFRVRTTESVAHVTTDCPQEAPLVLWAVHHQLEGVASLPQVLQAHDGHQVLVGLEHEGVRGTRGGAHQGAVAVLLVYDVHESSDGGEMDHLDKLQRLQTKIF